VAVEVIKDIIEGSGVSFVGGRIVELTRIVEVTGLAADKSQLLTVEGELHDADMEFGDPHPDLPSLFVEDYSISGNAGPYNMSVAVTYRYQSNIPILLSAAGGIEQVTSNIYPKGHTPNAEVPNTNGKVFEGPGRPIILGPHPDFTPSQFTVAEAAPDTGTEPLRLQGAAYTAGMPRATTQFMNVLSGNEAQLLAHVRFITNRTNARSSEGANDADTQMCTSVSMEPVEYTYNNVDLSYALTKARFFYDLSFKEEGWQPIVVLGTNPRDGQFVIDTAGGVASSASRKLINPFKQMPMPIGFAALVVG